MPLIQNEKEHRDAFDLRIFLHRREMAQLRKLIINEEALMTEVEEMAEFYELLECVTFDIDRFETEEHYTRPTEKGLELKAHLRSEIGRLQKHRQELLLLVPKWDQFKLALKTKLGL